MPHRKEKTREAPVLDFERPVVELERRLEELSDVDAENVSDVSGELALARFLAERCALSNPALCNAILGNIAKLAIAAQRYLAGGVALLDAPAALAWLAVPQR